jgi:hypothetical protein
LETTLPLCCESKHNNKYNRNKQVKTSTGINFSNGFVALKENFTNFASWENKKLGLSYFTETISTTSLFFPSGQLGRFSQWLSKENAADPERRNRKGTKNKERV